MTEQQRPESRDLPYAKPELFKPGDILEFADIPELVAFEDSIAQLVDPSSNPMLWANRVKISEFVRPKYKGKLFIGTVADIKLIVMNEPYERLMDANERGMHFQHSRYRPPLSETNAPLKMRYVGFSLAADARSSGRGSVGQIQAELWYYPVSFDFIPKGTIRIKRSTTSSGEERLYTSQSKKDHIYKHSYYSDMVIRRVVTKPKLEEERFIEFDETARRIGFKTLQKAMIHPLIVPMRD